MLKKYFPLFFGLLFFGNIYSQTTAIPNANFEQALIDLGIDSDMVVNQSVATSDISAILILDVKSKNISDLTGIEGFTALTELRCDNNQLTSLDVSQNTALFDLNVSQNLLTSLDVTQNTSLSELWCQTNQLTSLDVSQNTSLEVLVCNNNQLTSLDVSLNTSLIVLYCHINQLTSLDLGQNIALEFLVCNNNQLTSLDVSLNTSLEVLASRYNQLTSLNVNQNTSLIVLYCHDNQLTSLDVSQNTDLIDLRCGTNQLTSLDVKNGNNSNFTYFDALNNPDLTCIQVDNAAYSAANWSNKDATATYSENCGYLGIDDEQLAKAISFYPNPVTNLLTIDSEIPLTIVEIYSILGRKVKEVDSGFESIPTNNLSNGIYVVRMFSEDGMTTRKLIKH